MIYDYNNPCLGIDVSHWNGTPNFPRIKAAGVQFVIHKITEGSTYIDPTWRINRQKIVDAGLFLCGYHFIKAGFDANVQINAYINALGRNPATMGHFLDVELDQNRKGPSYGEVLACVRALQARIPGQQIGVYTGGWYWKGYLKNPPYPPNTWMWDSVYLTGKGDIHTLLAKVTPQWFMPYGGITLDRRLIRQYTSTASVGNLASVDANVFYGPLASLKGALLPSTGGGGIPNPSLPASLPNLTRTLTVGMVGTDVKAVQTLLHKGYGYYVPISGTFDNPTWQAVGSFQSHHPPLKVDYAVGPLTYSRLLQG